MDTSLPAHPPHPAGEQPPVEDWSATVDTFAGRVHVEWNSGGLVTPLGQDAVRRGLAKIDEAAGLTWLQRHLDSCVWPLLTEPWVLDIDSTIKPLYGRQEGAMVGYNPHKPGRPSHCYHTYLMANLRLV